MTKMRGVEIKNVIRINVISDFFFVYNNESLTDFYDIFGFVVLI